MKRLRVMTVAICVLWAGAAAAQTASVLVSNVNQGTDIDQTIGEPHVAQPFTTGTASTAGFSITAITIETKKADDTFALAVCGVQTADGVPDVPNATCTAFTAPTAGFSAIGDKTFTHSGMNVEPSTTYAVSIRVTSTIDLSNRPKIEATAADTEDSVSMTGWSIHDKHRWYEESTTQWKLGNNNSYRLKIEGFVNTFPVAQGIAVTSSPQRWSITPNNSQALKDVYGAGGVIEFTVTFNEAVTVTGTPRLPLLNMQYANYQSGSDTSTLKFTYTVQTGDADTDGINLEQDALELNGGTILATDDSAAALITHSAVSDQSGHKVDGSRTGPWVKSLAVTSTPGQQDNIYGLSETIRFTATFSAAVTVTGAPVLGFGIGDVERQAEYSAADSSGAALVLSYIVTATDLDTDGLFIYDQRDTGRGLQLNGGTIKAGGVNADLIHPGRGTQADHKVDGRFRSVVQNLMAEKMGDGITLSWDAPANIAGATVTGYEYRYARLESELDSKPYTALGRRTCPCSVPITDFPVYDRLYYFDVRPQSDQGLGNTSRITATPQRRVPAAVQYLRVIPGQDSLYLAWRPPESPGYADLIRYEYRYAQGSTVPDGTSWTEVPPQTTVMQPDPDVSQYEGPSQSDTIHFLMSDQLYTVEVRAINGDTPPHNEGTVARATVMTDVTPPQLVRATVDGNMLALDYNEDLQPGTYEDLEPDPMTMDPPNLFDGSSVTVTAARVTAARVILTLNPAVMAGDTVTLNYTGSGEIADLANNAAAAFNDHPVVNVTGQDKLDVTPPALESAEVAGYTLVATWDEELDPKWVPLPTNFNVVATSADLLPIDVDRVQLCGTKVTLTLAKSFDHILHLYYVGGPGGLRDLAGNRARGTQAATSRWAQAAPHIQLSFL